MESGKQKVGKHSPKSVLKIYKEESCLSSSLSSPMARLDKGEDSAKRKAESGK